MNCSFYYLKIVVNLQFFFFNLFVIQLWRIPIKSNPSNSHKNLSEPSIMSRTLTSTVISNVPFVQDIYIRYRIFYSKVETHANHLARDLSYHILCNPRRQLKRMQPRDFLRVIIQLYYIYLCRYIYKQANSIVNGVTPLSVFSSLCCWLLVIH